MKTECNCHELKEDRFTAERPRYFARQLITADDLTLGQEYARNKSRRHNRLLHGWGVVCAALACPVWKCKGTVLEPWKVLVQPGYIVDPFGNEIIIESAETVNVRGPQGLEPECEEFEPSGPSYLAVKYKERQTRPVRVQPVGCGCDEQPCEYSRFYDAYEFGLLKSRPESHKEVCENTEEKCRRRMDEICTGGHPDCPPCPTDPWVVLAKIDIAEDGLVSSIDNSSCRRLVITAAALWRKCTIKFEVKTNGSPFVIVQGVKKSIQMEGAGVVKVYAGPGITSNVVKTRDDKLEIELDVANDAEIGTRNVIVVNGDCSTVSFKIQVDPAKRDG